MPCYAAALTSAQGLAAIKKSVKDTDAEAEPVDGNTLINAVKHSGKVHIWR